MCTPGRSFYYYYTFTPKSERVKLSLPSTFAPWNSLPGTFAPESENNVEINFRSPKRKMARNIRSSGLNIAVRVKS